MRKATFASSLMIVLALAALGCNAEVPAMPTFTKDVGPIFAAHCVRCHDETFRADPMSKAAAPLPMVCHLNRFESAGDCSAGGAGTCSYGAQVCSTMVGPRVTLGADAVLRMPPPPADPLNDWEKDVLTRWAANPLP